ncbi:MAG: NAD-dependent epimerase/dehydratase family protein [Deltaproteobacteria bacterium]|nr:NAD-dependent epimerase/dehydratase family protein [Deltaproteobacteria bacterium]
MILITGGAGFLGSHLVTQLLDEGQTVRVLERPGARVDHLPLDRIELVSADIRDEPAVREAVRDCEYVYHLAADANLWRRDRQEFDSVNRLGTVHVMRAALDNGAKRILHTSTESILSSPDSNGGAVENLRLKASDMLGPYCLSKFHAEEEVFKMVEEGAPIIVVSSTLPVGPGDRGQTPPTRMSVAFCKGELPAYLDCRFNLIDARDVATGMVLAMRKGRTGIRYLLGGENLRLSDWLGLLGVEAGQPVPRWKVPYSVALAVAWFSEIWADWVSGKMPMATMTGVRLTRRNMFFDPSASLKELGLHCRPIREAARDAVAWYRSQGWI